MAQKKILKLSFEEWQNLVKNKIVTSCGVTFTDGFRGTYCLERVGAILGDIKFLMTKHGDVAYISCTR